MKQDCDGMRIGKYELKEYLGGGMADVYRATDSILGKTVAIKILKAETCSDPDMKERFVREARMAATIEHPNILSVYDLGEENGRPYMVMEFLRGEDLRAAIYENHAGDLLNRLRIMQQLARALEYVQQRKIVHRDIKPDNVRITASGEVKLIDFGVAKVEGLEFTQAGAAIGTLFYMAPEQILGKPITGLVDIYAFGILLFELFTGKRPIEGESISIVASRILHQPIDLEPLRSAQVPQRVIALVEACTTKDPAGRPKDFTEILLHLDGMIRDLERQTTQRLREPEPWRESERPGEAATQKIPDIVVTPRRFGQGTITLLTLGPLVIICAALGLYWYLRPIAKEDGPLKPPVENTVKPAEFPATLASPAGDMVLIPGGEYLSGADKQPVALPAFYIDRTEVTNAAYLQFCEPTGNCPPRLASASPDLPVANITIEAAKEFARWAGKRLPTLREWEKAARGTDGRNYPWGNDLTPGRANVAGDGQSSNQKLALAAVGDFASGDSPFGVRQMEGNVWEFIYEPGPPTPTVLALFQEKSGLSPKPTSAEPWFKIIGGSYGEPLQLAYEAAQIPARFRSQDIGFRCVRDAR